MADDDQPGLYLKVGKTAKSWVVQTEVRVLDDKMKPVRKTVRRAFAAFPDHEVAAHLDESDNDVIRLLDRLVARTTAARDAERDRERLAEALATVREVHRARAADTAAGRPSGEVSA